MKLSNIKVTKKGLVEKSSGRKIVSPLDKVIYEKGLQLSDLSHLTAGEACKLLGIKLVSPEPWI